MELYVEICERWSYSVHKPNPGSRGERTEVALDLSVAVNDHVMGFGLAISCFCTNNLCAHMGPRIVEWNQRTTTKVPDLPSLSGDITMRRSE